MTNENSSSIEFSLLSRTESINRSSIRISKSIANSSLIDSKEIISQQLEDIIFEPRGAIPFGLPKNRLDFEKRSVNSATSFILNEYRKVNMNSIAVIFNRDILGIQSPSKTIKLLANTLFKPVTVKPSFFNQFSNFPSFHFTTFCHSTTITSFR
jgi:hypothetical protein